MRSITLIASSECPPNSKKWSLPPDALELEHIGQICASVDSPRHRGPHSHGQRTPSIGHWQRLAVHLANRRQRQRMSVTNAEGTM